MNEDKESTTGISVTVSATPWYETRTLVPVDYEMIQPGGLLKRKSSYLRDESPRNPNTVIQLRWIAYNRGYVKYCFLKEFYGFLFAEFTEKMTGSESVSTSDLIEIVSETIAEFFEFIRQDEELLDPKLAFQEFCKLHLYQ